MYTVVTAEKWFCFDDKPRFNIAAFSINENTFKYIGDCFQALSHTWGGVLSEIILFEYRNMLSQYYNRQCMKLFNIAVKANSDMERASIVKQCVMFVETKKEELKIAKDVIVYGGGRVADEINRILQKENIKILAVVVSNSENNRKEACGFEVKEIIQLSGYQNKKLIIASIIDEYTCEMEQTAIKLGFNDILKIDKNVY